MSNSENTLSKISAEFGIILGNINQAIQRPPRPLGLIALLQDAGLDIEGALVQDELEPILNGITTAYEPVQALLENGVPSLADIPTLVAANRSVVEAIQALSQLDLSDNPVIAASLPRQILDFFILQHLETSYPTLYHSLLLTGLATKADPSNRQPARFNIERMRDLLKDPIGLFKTAHHWGTPNFNSDTVIAPLTQVLAGLGFQTYSELTASETRVALGEATPKGENEYSTLQLRLPFLSEGTEAGIRQLGLVLLALLPTPAGDDGGLALLPFGNTETSFTQALDTRTTFSFNINSEATVPFGIVARPDAISLTGIGEQTAPASVDLTAQVLHSRALGAPSVLFSQSDIGAVEISSMEARLGVAYSPEGELDTVISFPVEGRLALRSPAEDGFLSAVLPEEGISAPLSLNAGWSQSQGIFLGTAGALETTVPINKSLMQAFQLDSATYKVGVAEDRVLLSISISGAVGLGSFKATLEQIGLEVSLSFDEQAIVPTQIDYRFKPPEGLTLALDSTMLTGGGFLQYNEDSGEYEGLIQLKYNSLMLTGIGILNTRRPNSEPGFSLVLLITGEFPPVQLGFGFTLNGVGGLLGVNRTANIQALQEGVRSGAIASVMFPENPLANAPRILSDMQTFFPQGDGSHLFGPMAKIGWGSTPIMLAEIGIVFEFPDPLRLLLFGQLHVGLPSLEKPITDLHMDIFGSIDFDAGKLSIDASLVDSTIAGYRISGDAALRVRWKTDPDFALAIGGFHPRAIPPAGFPALKRVTLNLTQSNNPRLRFEGYFALTASTVQCGARIEAYAKKGKFSAEAFLSFDTLFQFDPFRFVIEMAAGAVVKGFGRTITVIDLALLLSGPKPWHAMGKVTFRFSFLRYSVNFDLTIGDKPERTPIEPVDVRSLLIAELKRPTNWIGQLPPSSGTAVSLREVRTEEDAPLLIHPQGRFGVRQTVVPLGETLEKYGEKPIQGDRHFEIVTVSVGGHPVAHTVTEAQFAPAQYRHLSEIDRLTQPTYASFKAGITAAPESTKGGDRVSVIPGYENIVIDKARGHRSVVSERATLSNQLSQVHERSAIASKLRSHSHAVAFPGKKQTVRLKR